MRPTDVHFVECLAAMLWENPGTAQARAHSVIHAASAAAEYWNRASKTNVVRISKILIQRARQERAFHPRFGPIPALGRLVIAARHLLGLSPASIAESWEMDLREVEKLLWQTRVFLGQNARYPASPSQKNLDCPYVDASCPWPQSLLDRDCPSDRPPAISGGTQHFLTRHLSNCVSCSEFFERCRHTYYAALEVVGMGTSLDRSADKNSGWIKPSLNPGRNRDLE